MTKNFPTDQKILYVYIPTHHAVKDQGLFNPLPYGRGAGRRSKAFSNLCILPNPVWLEQQYEVDHEHYSIYYDLLFWSSSIMNDLFLKTTQQIFDPLPWRMHSIEKALLLLPAPSHTGGSQKDLAPLLYGHGSRAPGCWVEEQGYFLVCNN